MANTATLGSIIRRGLVKADFPALAGGESGNLVRQDLVDFANESLSDIHYLLASSFEEYFLETIAFNIDSSAEVYALPDDFYKLRKMFFQSGSRRYEIGMYTLNELNGYSLNPVTSGTVEMWYIPEFTPLVDDGDQVSVAIPVQWEQLAVLGVAIKCLDSEESDSSALSMKFMQQSKEIKENAHDRDAGEAHRISDSSGRYGLTQAAIIANEGRFFRYRLMGNNVRIMERVELRGAGIG